MSVILPSYEWSLLALPLITAAIFVLGSYFVLRHAHTAPLALKSLQSKTAVWQLAAAAVLVVVLSAASVLVLDLLEDGRTAAVPPAGANVNGVLREPAVPFIALESADAGGDINAAETITLVEFLTSTGEATAAPIPSPSRNIVNYSSTAYTALLVTFSTFSILPVVLLGLAALFFFVAIRHTGSSSSLRPEQTAVSGRGEIAMAQFTRLLLLVVSLLTIGSLISLSLVATL